MPVEEKSVDYTPSFYNKAAARLLDCDELHGRKLAEKFFKPIDDLQRDQQSELNQIIAEEGKEKEEEDKF